MKTNAVRVLDRAGVRYELRAYVLEGDDRIAERAAEALGMAPETVFKTLVAHGDQTGYLFALIPAMLSLDPRLLAAASGNKRVDLAPQREVLALTGYERGAVTCLAAKKAYPVFIDETAELWERIGISAGAKGWEITLAPGDLVRVTGAKLADIAR